MSLINQLPPVLSSGYGLTAGLSDFVFFMGYDIAHESGHTLGLVHTFNKDPFDVMSYLKNWMTYPRSLSFNESGTALALGLDQTATLSRLTTALKYYTDERTNYGSGSVLTSADFQGPDGGGTPPLPAQAVMLTDDQTGNPIVSTFDFGAVDKASVQKTETLDVSNYGINTVTVESVNLSGDPAFSLQSTGFTGDLEPGQMRQFQIHFTPGLGPKMATLSLQTTAQQTPLKITLTGQGTVANPGAQVDASNN